MAEQSHTPGSWGVEDPMDHCLTIVANPDAPVYDWKWVATCDWPSEEDHDITSEEVKANARLIASAPDLLSALEDILDAIGTHDPDWAWEERKNARAAIAKATGGSV